MLILKSKFNAVKSWCTALIPRVKGAARRYLFSQALSLYAAFRYSANVHPHQLPAKVHSRRYFFKGMFFDFLLAGMIGDAWYGKSNHLTYMEQIARCIHDGDVVLDLGAHQGFFTMIYRLLVGAEGAVYAVEPFDHFTDVIRFNASLNKFSNVYVLNCGLDEEKSIHKITSISARSAEKAKNQFSNYVISLHLNDFSVLKPDFVKIDIEGFELDAFRHAEVFLECKPMFLLSIHPCFIEARKENYQEIFDCLQKHDYLFGKVDVKGNFTERTIPSLAHPVSFEVLAIPRSKIPKIKKEA